MAANLFLRAKPLSKQTTRSRQNSHVLLRCAKHNLREMYVKDLDAEVGSLDPRLSHLNMVLVGPSTANGVVDHAADLCSEAGVYVTRANATCGYELIVSLPNTTTVNCVALFNDAVAWAIAYFRVPVISAVIHFDQDQPHVHMLLLPLRDGKWLGSRLIGPRAAISAMQKNFSKIVARKYGLLHDDQLKRQTMVLCRDAAEQVIDQLADQGRDQRDPAVVDALAALIERDPGPLLNALGLIDVAPPPKPMRTIKECADEGPSYPPVYGMQATEKTSMSYVLLADRVDEPASLGAVEPPECRTGIDEVAPPCDNERVVELTRVREDELPSSTYDLVLGEFPTGPTTSTNILEDPPAGSAADTPSNVFTLKPAKDI